MLGNRIAAVAAVVMGGASLFQKSSSSLLTTLWDIDRSCDVDGSCDPDKCLPKTHNDMITDIHTSDLFIVR